MRMKKDYTNSIQTLHFDIKGTWEGMEECCRMGLAKSIGVCNYSCAKLSTLLQNATIPPAVNQVELNVCWQQQKLIEFCKHKGIHVCAFSPLGAYGSNWGTNAVMESPILKDIAAAKNKTVAQVELRWIRQRGVIPIVRSFNKERMRQNLEIVDWELTDEEVGKIRQIPQQRACNPTDLVGPHAQYKSLEELWDGEI
ncbi:UNVERIFIED_CONTAM: Deoxymugineic acid synthase 1 [Sesamum latifolium]|uniref:Deoxymugineic acid synthase 1 n=1 Tax=Sesamum latifolium TaxID=2727402 RepID=A0AAW2UJQ2_9LAMI